MTQCPYCGSSVKIYWADGCKNCYLFHNKRNEEIKQDLSPLSYLSLFKNGKITNPLPLTNQHFFKKIKSFFWKVWSGK